jgi:hypothetical protein
MEELKKVFLFSSNSQSAKSSHASNADKMDHTNVNTPLNNANRKEITIVKTNFSITTRFKNISNMPSATSSDWIQKNQLLQTSESRLAHCQKENLHANFVRDFNAVSAADETTNRTDECGSTNEFNLLSLGRSSVKKINAANQAVAEKPFSPRPKFYMMANLNDQDNSMNSTLAFENKVYDVMGSTNNAKDVDSSDKTNFQSFEDNNSASKRTQNPNLKDATSQKSSEQTNANTTQDMTRKVHPEKKPTHDAYLYFYSNSEKYTKIFEKRIIEAEKVIHDDKLINAILLVAIPPEKNDMEILKELYGSNALIDRRGVQCCIKFRREILESYGSSLLKISDTKFLFLKNISFSSTFPKHEFRANYQF